MPQQGIDGVSLLPALEDPATPEMHHTQYFEMMGSRSIYHEGWKATTNHISAGVLDEEELATGSRNFDEDRWELFDLTMDFSEATDRAAEQPERLRQLEDLWSAEAERNNVLPISDGLVDRFAGFIPPTWPAGSSRTFRPGGGPVADESVPLLWGGFAMTSTIDAGPGTDEGVIFALGDWFGGYALYVVAGVARFTFARAADALELAAQAALAPGAHEIGVFYEVGPAGSPGRMALTVDWTTVDEIAVEGTLPLAMQHGGAGLRLGCDTGFPVSPRYAPPAPFTGTVHQLRIDAPGPVRPDGADVVARRAPLRLTPVGGRRAQTPRPTACVAWARCSRVWRAATAARSRVGSSRPYAGPNAAVRSSSSSPRARRTASRRRPLPSRRATVSAGPTAAARTACAALSRSMSAADSATPPPLAIPPIQAAPWAWPSAMWWRTTPTVHPSPGTVRAHSCSLHERAKLQCVRVGGGEVVRQRGRPLTRHGAPRPLGSGRRSATSPAACPRRRRGRRAAATARSPAWAHRAAGPAARSPR